VPIFAWTAAGRLITMKSMAAIRYRFRFIGSLPGFGFACGPRLPGRVGENVGQGCAAHKGEAFPHKALREKKSGREGKVFCHLALSACMVGQKG
jgi:hypothetical protein